MKDLISHRIFIDNCCMTTGGILTKDLRIFENRPLNKIVIVDNSIYSFIWQIDNGIPIIPYYDNKNDKELYDLENYLNEMLKCKDVMEFNRYLIQIIRYLEITYFCIIFGKILHHNNYMRNCLEIRQLDENLFYF